MIVKKILHKRRRIFVFIDASNIIYGASELGWKVDFEKLIKYLKERFGAKKVFYYAGLDPENKKQLKFYEKLQEFGFILRLVPLKIFKGGIRKGDVDSRLTFDLMKLEKEYDEAIVMTGDGDYFWVLEYLLKRKMIWVFSFSRRTAKELKKLVEDRFANLESLRKILELKKVR